MPYAYKTLAFTSNASSNSTSTYPSYTTVYTVPSGKSVIINRILLNNTANNQDIEYRFRLVPSGATASDNHLISVGEGTSNRAKQNTVNVITNASDPIVMASGDSLLVTTRPTGTGGPFTTIIVVLGVEIS